jgi:hypothetical protein
MKEVERKRREEKGLEKKGKNKRRSLSLNLSQPFSIFL